MMDYSEVQRVILDYAPEKAQDFADRFSRFPCEQICHELADYLCMRSEIYRKISPPTVDLLTNAAKELMRRASL